MSNGPTLIYDKSAIQRLSAEEAKWLTHFFRCTITPVFQLEVLGNLSKAPRKGTPEARVASLAARAIDGFGTIPNVPHTELITGEILGNPVNMRGVPIVAAQRVVAANGEVGAFIDETPEEQTLQRWSKRVFSDDERRHSAGFRSRAKSSTALHDIIQTTKGLRKKGVTYASTLPELLLAVDLSLNDPAAQFRTLSTALEMFDQPEENGRHVKKHWVAHGRPPIRHFLPYTHFCMRVASLFMHGVGLGIIGQRPTNLVDLQYLYYLPFTGVFTSADQLHAEMAPLFLTPQQRFISANDLQTALRELAAFYSQHDAELRAQGSMRFAAYPPLSKQTAIHDLYDALMPKWRARAVERREPITPEENARIMAKLKPMMDAINTSTRGREPQ